MAFSLIVVIASSVRARGYPRQLDPLGSETPSCVVTGRGFLDGEDVNYDLGELQRRLKSRKQELK